MTREEAIELLKNLKVCKQAHTLFNIEKEAVDMAIEALKERPHGEWIPQDEFEAYNKCSNCGIMIDNDFPIWRNFCPNCGIPMRKEGDPE